MNAITKQQISEHVIATLRTAGAITPEQIKATFGPCAGAVELIELTDRIRTVIASYTEWEREGEARRSVAWIGDELDTLCVELRNWCTAHGVPYESADELAPRFQTDTAHRHWLDDFIERWDAAVARGAPHRRGVV